MYFSRTFFFILFSIGLLFQPTFADAHVLQTSGTIGAVLHINPNDEPVAGSVSTFIFEFKDTKKNFLLADCVCNASVIANGKNLYTTQLSQEPVFTYTFPTAGVYTIKVAGASLSQRFSPFSLSYIVRVEQAEKVATNPSIFGTVLYHTIHYGIFIVGFIVLVVLVIREKKKQKKGTPNNEKRG